MAAVLARSHWNVKVKFVPSLAYLDFMEKGNLRVKIIIKSVSTFCVSDLFRDNVF